MKKENEIRFIALDRNHTVLNELDSFDYVLHSNHKKLADILNILHRGLESKDVKNVDLKRDAKKTLEKFNNQNTISSLDSNDIQSLKELYFRFLIADGKEDWLKIRGFLPNSSEQSFLVESNFLPTVIADNLRSYRSSILASDDKSYQYLAVDKMYFHLLCKSIDTMFTDRKGALKDLYIFAKDCAENRPVIFGVINKKNEYYKLISKVDFHMNDTLINRTLNQLGNDTSLDQ